MALLRIPFYSLLSSAHVLLVSALELAAVYPGGCGDSDCSSWVSLPDAGNDDDNDDDGMSIITASTSAAALEDVSTVVIGRMGVTAIAVLLASGRADGWVSTKTVGSVEAEYAGSVSVGSVRGMARPRRVPLGSIPKDFLYRSLAK